MLNELINSHQPRYRSLADALIAEITSGRLTRGETLPSEYELVERFKVSRYTVREALRVLEDTGMISRHQGKGTLVTGRFPSRAYVQMHRSFPKLLQYPADTHFHLEKTQRITADGEHAERLCCSAGREWLVLSGIRRHDYAGTPFCWTDIYLDPDFGWLAGVFGHENEPAVWPLIRELDENIHDVKVELTARQLPDGMAQKLDRKPGTASLSITRSLLTETGSAFVIDISEHPEGNLDYTVDFRREWLAG